MNKCILLVVIAMSMSACSIETFKRTIFETLQNAREQECLKTPSADCRKRDAYEDYERQRKALEQNK